MGMGDGDGERIRRVGAVWRGARQEPRHHGPDLHLVAVACPDHGLLDGVRRILETPSSAGTSMAMPRAWPSFSVAEASRLTKVCSMAASTGDSRASTSCSPSNSWRSLTPSASPSSEQTEPQAT